MTNPLIPQIIELASPIAQQLGLEVVGAVFHTNRRPPVLRLDVRNQQNYTSLEDCEKMSKALEEELDGQELMPGSYILEISSPGVPTELTTDKEFSSFKGFDVIVSTVDKELRGKLQGRDEDAVYLNQKGKAITIPRDSVKKVQLNQN